MKNKHYSNKNVLENVQIVAQDIRDIKIQWATAVVTHSLYAMKSFFKEDFKNKKRFLRDFYKALDILSFARPTEPMLFNAISFLKWKYKQNRKISFSSLLNLFVIACDELLEFIANWDSMRATIWADLIEKWWTYLTHCHSSNVVKLFVFAHNQWKDFHVINTETRPLFQWRKTSKELVDHGIETSMITDDMAEFLLDKKVEKKYDIDAVFIGCDAIKRNGNIINKIWSYGIALSAYNANIPVYVVWSLLKFDYKNNIRIEERTSDELWLDAPDGLNIINYVFDEIPAKYISWVLTRSWIIKTKKLKREVKKRYPRLVK